MNSIHNSRIIPQLTGLRAIAAFMVFINHAGSSELTFWIQRVTAPMYVGVNIFFVLSGFLIFYRYYDGFALKWTWFWPYLKKRFARIYPLYFFITTITFAYYYIANINTTNLFRIYILNITFLRGFLSDLIFSGIPQGWSLTAEECFYMSAPFLFLLRKEIPLFVQGILLLIIGFGIVKLFGTDKYYGFFSDNIFMLDFTFLGRVMEFIAGGTLALYIKNNEFKSLKTIYYSWVALLLILISIGLVSFFQYHQQKIFEIAVTMVLSVWISFLLYGLFFEKTFISKFLSTPLMVLLGKSSYIFYLIHIGVIRDWINDIPLLNFNRYIHTGIVELPILIGASIILHVWVEEPLFKFIAGRKY